MPPPPASGDFYHRAFSLEVTAHIVSAGHRTPSLKLVLGLTIPKIWLIFGHGTLTFDL